jgi:sarcosine oxidase
MEHFDVIVLGTGAMGAAAAAHLARRGVRVCGLDRFPIAHDRGSSHGQTRLIRLAYFEHPDYVPLLQRAYELWHELEEAAGRRLLVESGLVLTGPPDGAAVAGTLSSAAIHGLAVERLSASEAHGRWPALRAPDDWVVVHEPRGGYLFVEECVRAHATEAARHGARFEHGVQVHGWRSVPSGGGSHVVVETNRGPLAAERLVIAAGAWASDLLRLPRLRLRVLRKSLFWYAPAAPEAHAAGRLPCFACDGPAGFYYGFPAIDGRGVKIAEHTGGIEVVDPLEVDRSLDTSEQARVDEAIGTHLPLLGNTLTAHATCLYTMSPDGHFVLGLHPEEPAVALAAGFSGHGFKFASVIGQVLADLAIEGRTSLPVGFLSPTRWDDRAPAPCHE